MKRKYFITCLFIIILLTNLFSQNQGSFYQGLDDYFSSNLPQEGEGFESTEYNEILRVAKVWSPRLFAHDGDAGAASAAVIDYAQNFNPIFSSYDPNWKELGPVRKPINGGYPRDDFGVGRVERLCFDPNYNIGDNKTIYAASSFGGLWRTENDGLSWHNANTDNLKITAIADVAVSHQDSRIVFIATGIADGRNEYQNSYSHINALQTIGIYRSLDYCQTWEPINEGFISHFNGIPGTIRRMIINPDNENQLLVASSIGVFRCNNATEPNPIWELIYNVENDPRASDFRGLAFKPDNSDIFYISSNGVWETDDGGETFSPLTAGDNVFNPNESLQIERINITTTPAPFASDYVYAYVIYKDQSFNGNRWIFLYRYDRDDDDWENFYIFEEPDAEEAVSTSRMPIVVSPDNKNEIYIGHTKVKGSPNFMNGTYPIDNQSPYASTEFHADVHDLAFPPNTAEPDLFAATDGGVSIKDLPNYNINGWSNLYEGLAIQTIWSFDESQYESNKIIIGNQDNGTMRIEHYNNIEWTGLYGSDGYGVAFDNGNIDSWFLMNYNGEYAKSFQYYDNLDDYFNEWAKRPELCAGNLISFIPNRLPTANHPKTNDLYFGFTDLFQRLIDFPTDQNTWDEIWQVESNTESILGEDNLLPEWKRQFKVVKIAESDPNVIYIVTTGADQDPLSQWDWNLPSLLFKSMTGGIDGNCNLNNFSFVNYPGYDPDPEANFPIINDLVIDPEDANRIWIAYTGFDSNYKIRYSSNGGESWDVNPMDEGLPNLPVNVIKYQHGSNDILYAGTDAGVYVYINDDVPHWEKYGDIPNVRINDLSINYCSNTLRAGTFGRGLWEADLMPIEGSYTHKTISENTIWENNWSLKGDLVIESGATLTITKTVNMTPNSKIIIEPQAQLIIDGGYITNRCGYTWEGIEVWGDPLSSNPIDQGKLRLINGAILENATVAIRNNSYDNPSIYGGIVEAEDSFFFNNKVSVDFKDYSYTNLSYFTECDFVRNDDYLFDKAQTFVNLNNVQGPAFNNCLFEYISSPGAKKHIGYGIKSTNSKFVINGGNTLFSNLNYAIYSIANIFTMGSLISDANFIDNHRAFYVSGIDNMKINNNTFEIPPQDPTLENPETYGLYLHECSAYTVEENRFTNPNSPFVKGDVGIYINNSGEDNNLIYLNIFDGLEYGSVAFGNNKDRKGNNGLRYRCNTFDDNTNDLVILYDDFPGSTQGIAKNQGFDDIFDPTSVAGNTFTNNGVPYSSINNEATLLNYFYPLNSQVQEVEPDYVFNVNKVPQDMEIQWTWEAGCPESGSGGGGGLLGGSENLTTLMETSQTEAQNIQLTLDAIVDGGVTQQTVENIETSYPPETYEVYNDLMVKSPNLSSDVVDAAIEKEEVLPNPMIRDVMVANPQSAKDDELVAKLDDRNEPVPEYMKAQILEGRDLLSYMEGLESQKEFHLQRRSLARNALINGVLYDETLTPEAKITGVLNLLDESLSDQYKKALCYLALDDMQSGLSILNSIPGNFELTTDEQAQLDDFAVYYQLINDYLNSDILPDENEMILLEDIYQSNNNFIGGFARNFLISLEELEYVEPVILGDFNKSSPAHEYAEIMNNAEDFNFISLHPNPANDFVIIDYLLDITNADAMIKITDISGRIQSEIMLNNDQDQLVIDTKNYKQGIYFVTLLSNEKMLDTIKFTITN